MLKWPFIMFPRVEMRHLLKSKTTASAIVENQPYISKKWLERSERNLVRSMQIEGRHRRPDFPVQALRICTSQVIQHNGNRHFEFSLKKL